MPLQTTYVGSGVRDFLPTLARICCRVAIYIAKHQTKLGTRIAAGDSACIGNLAAAAACLCKYKNISAT